MGRSVDGKQNILLEWPKKESVFEMSAQYTLRFKYD